MRANRVLIGAIAVAGIDLALVFALFGIDGDPPDAFVIVARLSSGQLFSWPLS